MTSQSCDYALKRERGVGWVAETSPLDGLTWLVCVTFGFLSVGRCGSGCQVRS